MITTDELVELTEEQEQQNQFKLGTVVELFGVGTAKVQFDGEETPSEKQYAYLDSYIPEAGDRVLFGVLGGTYVILGKVNYNVSPSVEEEIDRYLFDLKKAIMQKGLKVSLGVETDTLTVNNGATIVGNVGVNGKVNATEISATGKIGFFGKTPTVKTNVYPLPTTNPTVLEAYNGINFIVQVLQSYGLF